MKSISMTKVLLCVAVLGLALVALAACGGGGGGTSDPAAVQGVLNKQLDAYRKKDGRALYNLGAPSDLSACSYDSVKDNFQGEVDTAWTDENITDASKLDYTDVKVQIEGTTAKVSFNIQNAGKVVDTVDSIDPLLMYKIAGHWYESSGTSAAGDCFSAQAGANSGQSAASPTARATSRAAAPTSRSTAVTTPTAAAAQEIDLLTEGVNWQPAGTKVSGVVQTPLERYSCTIGTNTSSCQRLGFEVSAGKPLTVKVMKLSQGLTRISHNLTVYEDEAYTTPVAGASTGLIANDGETGQFTVTFHTAKTYYFRCEMFPSTMQGTITVK